MARSATKFLLVMTMFFGLVAVAGACPSCSTAIAEGQSDQGGNVAAAFQYSIFFMLSMPFLLASFFGTMLYRLHRKAEALRAARRGLAPATPEFEASKDLQFQPL